MASFKAGILANMAGQLYSVAIGVLMVPAYVHYMGLEAYGLVSFFVALQAWFALLDAGISPTLIREISRFRAGDVLVEDLTRFVRSAELLFSVLGLVCGAGVFLARGWFGSNWFQLETVSVDQVSRCVALMGLMLSCRWLASLYRSGLIGLERFTLINVTQISLSTLKSVLVLLVLVWVSSDVVTFFVYQSILAVSELLIFASLFKRELPLSSGVLPSFQAFRPVVRFAGAMALLTMVWGILAQTDRLILSHFINLSAFGEYSLAAVAASSVAILATPFTQALQPRLVYIAARQDPQGFELVYRTGTQVLAWILGIVAGAAIMMGERILFIWVGNEELAARSAPLLSLYAAGHMLWAFSSLVFQLQYVNGKVGRHVVGTLLLAVLWIPAIYFLVVRFGAVGAAWAWFGGNALFFFGWMLETQRRMMPKLTLAWLARDVCLILACCFLIYWCANQVLPQGGRIATLAGFGLAAVFAALGGLAAGSMLRPMAARVVGHLYAKCRE
ncbi:oligosaccharide flippase family protein [Uliginosibacterium sp. TH139]|uniref:oligosaccharide flippase family protein n=1 Tax=Uliginosibacterium sp. TH139 TaxID=2067453 RepID=UPI000C7CF97F|nr:oligosaccharide flippase family protein [Uliginosibacterium sp. TH139]PLK49143.1 hypothetical protein C0V76_08045 [Uliginosibacterium sp. TH139]